MDHPGADFQNRNSSIDPLLDDGFVLLTELRPLVPVHPQHIRRMVRRGDFPAPVTIGGRTCFRRRDIQDWLRRQK